MAQPISPRLSGLRRYYLDAVKCAKFDEKLAKAVRAA
jgi:hypothetical protein